MNYVARLKQWQRKRRLEKKHGKLLTRIAKSLDEGGMEMTSQPPRKKDD